MLQDKARFFILPSRSIVTPFFVNYKVNQEVYGRLCMLIFAQIQQDVCVYYRISVISNVLTL